MKCCRAIAKWGRCWQGQIYSEGSGDDRAAFLQLTLNNDIKLNLGRGDTMKRLARFVELYPVLQQQAQTDGKRISYVDLRYDSGAAVGWAPLPPEESTQQQNQAQAEQQ